MQTRIPKTVLALATVTALALPTAAQARHGADDPAGHVRHSSHRVVQKNKKARKHVRHTTRHHARHGADDGPNHVRHGADDGPNHT
jgi:Ni/Co efflux regulator RcnB